MICQFTEKEKNKIDDAENKREILKTMGISFCIRSDNDYPHELKTLNGMPPVLYYKGDIKILNEQNSIAVIGTRTPSKAGKNLAFMSGAMIGNSKMNLVNGLALGCDAEAIRGALSVGGKCVGILPCGLDEIIPKENQQLAQEILEKGGCLLSEYPIQTKVQKYNYVQRDRLQSGVSQSVLVVEAELNSGTMHTVEFARKQYKNLACYYYKMLEFMSGNRYLQEKQIAQVLNNTDELQRLIKIVSKENRYEQMTLDIF